MSSNKKQSESSGKKKQSTLAALLEEKPKRGRPRHQVSRQNVYVALTPKHKQMLKQLAKLFPEVGVKRADIPDIAVQLLAEQMERLRVATSGRGREIPEGIVDFESLYLLWDIPLPEIGEGEAIEWTSVRLSPQPAIELGRIHGVFQLLFGTSRSEVFALAIAYLEQSLIQNKDVSHLTLH